MNYKRRYFLKSTGSAIMTTILASNPTGLLFEEAKSPYSSHKQKDAVDYLDHYNIVWGEQSKNSSESMPVGGGDVGLNIWVENDELLFYVSQSGTFDENNQMLKHGRVRVRLNPNPFNEADFFKQELVLRDGYCQIEVVKENHKVQMEIWVDVFHPVVHVETESNRPVSVEALYESWRTKDVEIPEGLRHACFSYTGYPGRVITYKDEIQFENNSVLWYHRNRDDQLLFNFIVEQQGLSEVKDQLYNTQQGRTFGGLLTGENMVAAGHETGTYVSTKYKAWKIHSKQPSEANHLKLYLNTGITGSVQTWRDELTRLMTNSRVSEQDAKQKTRAWWNQFWNRSYMIIKPDKEREDDAVWQISRNYHLFRYMLGCNAYGKYPSKFNGSLFTFDPVFVDEEHDWTPDFRQWGGGSFTAQNQRMVYWPLLKSGDTDLMPSQFNFYKNALPSAETRTQVYWGHQGASFTEQMENFGLPFAGGWGFKSGSRKRASDTEFGVQTNPWVKYHYVNQLEFCLMILDYYQYSGKDISEYLPFIKSALRFFDEHYQYRHRKRTGEPLDNDGKLVFYPSTAAETYKDAKNPTDVIAALRAILPRMIKLPEQYVLDSEKAYYKAYMQRVPEIPLDIREGHRVIKPAESWEEVRNVEIPELYTVFPYSLYGIGKPGLETAKNTWHYGASNEHRDVRQSWSQVGIFAARLGLTKEAADFITYKLSDSSWRFPSFWGPGFDWVPDVNHGGSGMITLQEMLMQTSGEKIYLFPAWPEDWDVNFKLHAPYQTTLEGEFKNGQLNTLNVNPASRKKDVQVYRNGKWKNAKN